MNDMKFALRQVLKNPGFSWVIVATLALGIGANVALFSVVNGVLLNPLPFPQPDQLVTLHQSKPNFENGAIPYPNFRDWQKDNQTFATMAIMRGFRFSLTGTGEAERVGARLVSGEFFTVLGVNPALGRNFTPEEDQPGAGPVAIISAGLWKRKFAGAPDVVGRSLRLDDKNHTIIGVLPADFALFATTDVFTLIGQWNAPPMQNRSAGLGLHGIGRIKAGVTFAQAQADMDRVMRNLAALYPEANRGNGARLVPLKEQVVGDVRRTLLLLSGAVGFVLLIACANVGNLLLARSTARAREFAIRGALGAGRWRLIRQLLAESVLLGLAGGGLGLLLAGWGTRAALGALPTALPRSGEIGLDARVLVFTLAVSLLAGLLSGLAPVFRTSRRCLAGALKEGGRGATGARHRAQGVLVAVEMALALVLLIGSGLMIRSLGALWNVDPGFRPDNVLTFELNTPPSMAAAGPEAARAAALELSDRLGSLPGVQAASFSEGASPLQGEDDLWFWIEGEPKPETTSQMHMALVYRVEPGYLAAMGIPLKRGRFFTNQDDVRSRPAVVIDEVLARQYFPNADPIGKRIHLGGDRDPSEIIGVVGHVKQWGLGASDGREALQAQLYEPLRQSPDIPSGLTVMVRAASAAGTAGTGPQSLLDSIRRVVQSQNSGNILSRARTMNEVIAGTLAPQRFSMILLDAFAAVALLLASVGLYGVVSCLVGQRTQELGTRVALGAQRRDILRLVLSHGMKMALGGVGLGLLAALGLTRMLANLLFGVSATDPATFAVTALLLAAVALLASFVPAWRATTVDPIEALRCE